MPAYLASIGDATDLSTWSNIPYYLLEAGLKNSLISVGLPLKPERLKVNKLLWNMTRPLLGSTPGGYQYSEQFARRLMSQYNFPVDKRMSIISLHPMLPVWPWPKSWRVIYYIDMTTRQAFDDYGVKARISPRIQRRALEQEKAAFHNSTAVIGMCQWAADSVINDYGIDATKVHVVPGGANLDEAQLVQLPPTPMPPPPSAEQPLRLGFLGKEWQRKGGPFLLQLADALIERGIPTLIRAIGPNLTELPAHPALQPLGFINKQGDTARFVAELRSWHFGTLFSEAEAFGISNRECLRLGVPVVAHAVGGIASTLPDDGCGQLFAAHPRAAEVADWIAVRISSYGGYLAWRAELAPRWREFTWDAAAEKLGQILRP